MKYTLAILTALGIALLVATAATYIPVPDRGPLFTAAPPPPEAEVIASRDITNVAFDGKGTVSYEYLADHVPARISPDEVPELRTARSYTKLKGVKEIKDGAEYTLESIFYAQKTFEEDNGSWRFIEYGTTTEDVWKKRPVSFMQKFKELMIPSAYAVVSTIYSGAGDGYVLRSGAFIFSSCRTNSTGTAVQSAITTIFIESYRESSPDPNFCTVSRAFLPFDTSSISTSATISSASLNVFFTSVSNGDGDGFGYVIVASSSQASATTLVTADFSKAGVVTSPARFSDSAPGLDVITTNTYTTFPFNAFGITNIKKSGQTSDCGGGTGVTCLSLREGHDDSATAPNTLQDYLAYLSASEETGTSQDPYLSVTYTVPITTGMTIGGSGTLNVGAGGNLRF